MAVLVARAVGFPLASELKVVAVARVALVERFGFSVNFSESFSGACSGSVSGFGSPKALSFFFGLPRVFVVVVLVLTTVGSSSVATEGFLLRVDLVAGFVASSTGFDGSLSNGVILTLRRGAAVKEADAGAEDAVARVRGAIS